MKKAKAIDPPVDPTLPNTELEIGGTTYRLLFDFAALGIAERKLAESGEHVNMLMAMDISRLGAQRLAIVFFASLVRMQPEMSFAQARALIDIQTFPAIYQKVVDAYVEACVPKRKDEKKKDEKDVDAPIAEQLSTGP